jgi:hypothetical protein
VSGKSDNVWCRKTYGDRHSPSWLHDARTSLCSDAVDRPARQAQARHLRGNIIATENDGNDGVDVWNDKIIGAVYWNDRLQCWSQQIDGEDEDSKNRRCFVKIIGIIYETPDLIK